ncbi:MAG: prepilin-type N-terminal cleavage/methylation domain-containing protein [Thermodesulfobacteriota bacterium]
MGKDMRYISFTDALPIEGRSQKRVQALTLVELLLAIAILGTLGAIAVPMYDGYIDKARNSAAIAGIGEIEGAVLSFQAERGRPPDTLAESGLPTKLDPWGRPYQYLRLQGVDKKDLKGAWRRDRFTNPLNTDFDLYSMGKDGASNPALTAKVSHDDIVRANNGAFVGLASEY